MAKFNTTLGNIVNQILAIRTHEDALEFFTGYVAWLEQAGRTNDAAQSIARSNIGWCYGEGMDPELVKMWRATTGAEHPAGPIEDMTLDEIFDAGWKWGTASIERNARLFSEGIEDA